MVASPHIALIFTQYSIPSQPYLTNWSASLRPQGFSFHIFSNNRVFTKTPLTSVFELGAPSGKLGTINYFLRKLVRYPDHFVKWCIQEQDFLIKDKIQIWARYAPLLVIQPNVIHLVNSPIYPRYSFIIKLFKSISIVSFRGHDTIVRPWVDDQWRESLKNIFNQCDYLHYVSNYLRQEGIKLGAPAERSFVIYPGIDVNFYKPSNDRTECKTKKLLTLVTVGRLVWQKGLVSSLKAIKALMDKGYNIHYSIVGDGIEREHLEFRAREMRINKNVRFFGIQSPEQVKQLLNSSDIYLQPSVTESICVAAMEASAMGLPVIASNVGGLPELIEHGVTGLLVPPDNPGALAEAIMALANNKEKRLEMGKQGRKKVVRDFSLEREVREWSALYHEALERWNCAGQRIS